MAQKRKALSQLGPCCCNEHHIQEQPRGGKGLFDSHFITHHPGKPRQESEGSKKSCDDRNRYWRDTFMRQGMSETSRGNKRL